MEGLLTNFYSRFFIYTALFSLASFIIMKLYSSIAKRDIFRFERVEAGFGLRGFFLSLIMYFFNVVKYLFLFPLYIAAWSLFVAVTIYALSNVGIEYSLFVSALLASTTRVMAYIDRDLALELAKMVPLTFIFAVVVQPSVFDSALLPRLGEILTLLEAEAPTYIALVVSVEALLRLLHTLFSRH